MDISFVPSIFGQLATLGDGTRARLLALLEEREFTVSELCQVTQLPQSTVSRHLGILAGDGWVAARTDGPRRPYRMVEDLMPQAAALWALVHEQLEGSGAWPDDAERVAAVLADRPDRSRAFFSASADRWDELREQFYGKRADLFPLLGLLERRWTVGDLGGGSGLLALTLAPLVERVVLVDRSREMIRAARRRLAGVANVQFRVGELEALPVADGELDIAVMALVLHHIPDPPKAMAEAARALAPGGRLLVVDMRPHDRDGFREEMGHVWSGFAPEQVLGWIEQAGLQEPSLRPIPADTQAFGPLLFVASARVAGRGRI